MCYLSYQKIDLPFFNMKFINAEIKGGLYCDSLGSSPIVLCVVLLEPQWSQALCEEYYSLQCDAMQSHMFTKKKLHGLSPRANYTDRATAACLRSDCQLVQIEGAMWSA
jgi:hypothetical protein